MPTTTAVGTAWLIDAAHSEVSFKVKHLVISTVTGYFREFEGSIHSPESGWEGSQASFSLHTASIDTNQADRDGHLRSDDFFNAEVYPKLSFASTAFEKISDHQYKVTGELTIRDITKTVSFDAHFLGEVKDPYGQHKAAFEIKGQINRQDFNLRWSALTETGGLVVSDEVRFELNVQVTKQA